MIRLVKESDSQLSGQTCIYWRVVPIARFCSVYLLTVPRHGTSAFCLESSSAPSWAPWSSTPVLVLQRHRILGMQHSPDKKRVTKQKRHYTDVALSHQYHMELCVLHIACASCCFFCLPGNSASLSSPCRILQAIIPCFPIKWHHLGDWGRGKGTTLVTFTANPK